MLLLPLGPKGKLPNFPLMSLAVGVCILAFSVYTFPSLNRLADRILKHEGYQSSLALVQEFTKTWCETEQLTTVECHQLSHTSSGLNLLSRVNLREAFKQNPKTEKFSDALISKLEAQSDYLEWRDYVQKIFKNGHWLTRQTVNATSVSKAQFAHLNWLHLMGSMLLFFGVAAAVEMKLGMLTMLVIYLIGGASVSLVYTLSFLPSGVLMLGSTAGTAALAGAYLALFQKYQTRILFSLIAYNKIILIPTATFIGALIGAQYVLGILVGEANNAYLYQLAALIFGSVCALIYKHFAQSELPFLYPHEQELFDLSQQSPEAIAYFDQILIWNPENAIVRDLAFAEVVRGHIPSAARLKFLEFHLAETISQLMRDQDADRALSIIVDLLTTPDLKQSVKFLSPSHAIFILQVLSVTKQEADAQKWVETAVEGLPELKRNSEFRTLAQAYLKKPAGAQSA